jgi:hypothetical protein
MSKVWIGTSGWTYDGWRGPFYPPDLTKTKPAALHPVVFRQRHRSRRWTAAQHCKTGCFPSSSVPPSSRCNLKAAIVAAGFIVLLGADELRK